MASPSIYLITYEASTGSGNRVLENELIEEHPVVWLSKIHEEFPQQRTVITNIQRMDFELTGSGPFQRWCVTHNGGEIAPWSEWQEVLEEAKR